VHRLWIPGQTRNDTRRVFKDYSNIILPKSKKNQLTIAKNNAIIKSRLVNKIIRKRPRVDEQKKLNALEWYEKTIMDLLCESGLPLEKFQVVARILVVHFKRLEKEVPGLVMHIVAENLDPSFTQEQTAQFEKRVAAGVSDYVFREAKKRTLVELRSIN
jgi:hypothetical protein